MKKYIKSSYLAFILIMIYIPILILIIFSFNSSSSANKLSGFSLKWYEIFFHNQPFLLSIALSLIIGVIVTFISVIIGTMAALGLSKTNKVTRSITLGVTNIPLINADVITAVSLMLLFVSLSLSFGPFTLILAHISFDIPYVIVIILPRIKKIDNQIIEASSDLGAKPTYTLFRIILPILKPAILTATTVAFTMSFDDFIISYFTGGSTQNVATYIYSLKKVEPYVNAFGTIIILIISIGFVLFNIFGFYKKTSDKKIKDIIQDMYKDKYILNLEGNLISLYYEYNDLIRKNEISNIKVLENKIKSYETKINKEKRYIVKIKTKLWKQQKKQELLYIKEINSNNKFKFFFMRIWKQTLLISVIMGSFFTLTALYYINSQYDINIAIWGEYLPNQLVEQFEQETGLKVRVNLFDSNESLYNKLQTYNKYDIMVPSAYMAIKLASKGYIKPIDYTKLVSPSDTKILAGTKENFWHQIDPVLNDALLKTENKNPNNKNIDLEDYQIPYYWGDIRTTFNMNNTHSKTNLSSTLLNDFNSGNYAKFSKDYTWNNFVNNASKNQNQNYVISDDPKNIFIANAETQLNWVEPMSNNDINEIAPNVLQWMGTHGKNVKLQGDEITNTFNNGNFNLALSYNGDVLTQMMDPTNFDKKYLPTYPGQGTDIWEDGMVINKKTTHTANVYRFINFMISNQLNLYKNNDLVYTSPFFMNEKAIANDIENKFKDKHPKLALLLKETYIPLYYDRNPDNFEPLSSNLSPGTGIFWYNDTSNPGHQSDSRLQSVYNQLIASKS